MLARRVFPLAAVVAVLCLFASPRPAAAEPLDQVSIDRSIEWGVKYLQKGQKANGYWSDDPKATWAVGFTALAGLTLAESNETVTNKDDKAAAQAAIQRAARVVRTRVGEIDSTYELALVILFLDRVKDKGDRATIQYLAARLISAQMPSGGWGYKVPKLALSDSATLLAALRKLTPPAKPKDGDPPFDLEKARKAAVATLPGGMRKLPVLFDPDPQLPPDAKDKRNDLYDATTDNSNTHFAMIGLWAARKYDVPTDRTFARVNRRFRTTQGPGGSWGYDFVRGGADGGGQHTCIALLGLAIGHVVSPEPGVKPESDPIVLNAFVSLSKTVGEPAGTTKNRPKLKDIPGGLYFMWAMERVAVLYDVQKLGKKDWYVWGAEILIGNQLADGSWVDGGVPGLENPVVNTSLALMFLRRANLTPDLSKRLVIDPTVLTAKVDDKVTPKPEPPPSPKIEPPPPSPKVEEPPPPPKVEPKVEPKKEPPAPAPVVTPAPQPEPASAPAKKTPWLWIVLGTALAGLVGGLLAFLVLAKRKKEDAEGEGEKKKKKGKKKAKAEGEEVAEEGDDEKPAKPTKKKVKAEVEEDEE